MVYKHMTMVNNQLIVITIAAVEYYNAFDLKVLDPVFFYGTSRSIKSIITKKNIPAGSYIFATSSKRNGWHICKNQETPPSKANVLLQTKWVNANVPKMMPEGENKYECDEAPPMLYLNDDEMFKDTNGNPIDIETRGERSSNEIYFLAKDIANAFGIPRLIDTINQCEGYVKGIDFSPFLCMKHNIVGIPTHKRYIYLTYVGVLRTLFTTRSKLATSFVSWATETIFTRQMGTCEQKVDMSAGMLGISAKSLTHVLNKSTVSVPCVYMFALGTVERLRASMDLPTNWDGAHIIIKFGLTENLTRRAKEHVTEYGKIEGAAAELLEFVYIDPKYLSEAETVVADYFQTIEKPVVYKKYKELMCIDPKHMKQKSEK